MYMTMVKTLAGVRVSTTNNLVLAELGLPSLETRVKKAQKLFIKKIVQTRVGLTDDPFMHIWQLCEANNTKGYQYFCKVLNEDLSVPEEIERRKISIKASTSSKSINYYCEINPCLEMHPMYEASDVKEHDRISATIIRLSSHDLAIVKRAGGRGQKEKIDYVVVGLFKLRST